MQACRVVFVCRYGCSVFVEGSLLNFFVLLICYISLFAIFELICL